MLETEIRDIFEAEPVQKVMPAELKQGLSDRLSGKISQEDLDILCAKFTLEKQFREHSTIHPKPTPPDGYTRYMDYTKKLNDAGEIMNPNEHNRAVKQFTDYWEQCDRVERSNQTNAEWILFCRETLRNVDAPLAIRADEALKTFIESGFNLGTGIVGLFLKSKEHAYGRYHRK